MTSTDPTFPYDVAISFAGEDRDYANQIAELLRLQGVRVFYDNYEQATLWGKDLYAHLAHVYREQARYCVMLLSQYYATKLWTNHERQSAQARAFRQNEEYILPVRLDDTEIPGIHPTIGYLDLRSMSVQQLVDHLLTKLGAPADQGRVARSERPAPAAITDIPLPKIKKSFSQLEQDRFLKEAFCTVRSFFQQALQALEQHDAEIATEFFELSPRKFGCSIYLRGNLKMQCSIWFGGRFMENAINVCQGQRIDFSNDSTLNNYVSLETDGYMLGFRASAMGHFFGGVQPDGLLTAEEVARYLWQQFIDVLSR
jgi:hypothetical protein